MSAEQGFSISLKAHPAIARRAISVGLLATAGFLAFGLLGDPAMAQSRSKPGIVINSDVLDSLGPGPAPLAPTPLAPELTPALPPSAGAGDTAAPVPLDPQLRFDLGSPGAAPATGRGGENYVVTRPGTLLFPPLQAPSSSLTPGFSQEVVREQRRRAFENAFADGPEPRSQLLLPLANANGAEGAPAAEDDDWVFETVIIDSRPSPQPAPRKPVPTAAMLAALEAEEPQEPGLQEALDQGLTPAAVETMELAPEFRNPAPAAADTADEVIPAAEPASLEAPVAAEPADSAVETAAQTAAADETPLASAPAAPKATADEEVTAANATNTVAMPSDATAPLSLLREDNPPPEATAPNAAATETTQVAEAALEGSENGLGTADGETAAAAPSAAGKGAPADPAPAVAHQQLASLPAGGELQDISFTFATDSAELTTSAQAVLQSLADDLRTMGEDRIQVLGYASSAEGSPDLDRQLALSRALKVRTFLIDAGIPSQRIQVRPPSGSAGSGPANRVDIRPVGS